MRLRFCHAPPLSALCVPSVIGAVPRGPDACTSLLPVHLPFLPMPVADTLQHACGVLHASLPHTTAADRRSTHVDNQISKASAYANCYASVVAEVWAFAMAEAAAQAQCWPGNDAKASADILAKVGVYITYEERCIIDVSESGLADAGVGNSGTFTGFVRLPATPADPLLHPGCATPRSPKTSQAPYPPDILSMSSARPLCYHALLHVHTQLHLNTSPIRAPRGA